MISPISVLEGTDSALMSCRATVKHPMQAAQKIAQLVEEGEVMSELEKIFFRSPAWIFTHFKLSRLHSYVQKMIPDKHLPTGKIRNGCKTGKGLSYNYAAELSVMP